MYLELGARLAANHALQRLTTPGTNLRRDVAVAVVSSSLFALRVLRRTGCAPGRGA